MARDDSVLYTGDTTGRVSRVDLRTLRLSGTYKGNTGSVRDIAIHPTLPRLATVGLDRIMRVFDSESRQQLHRVYLRQQLNAVLFTSEEEVKMFAEEESEEESDVSDASDLNGVNDASDVNDESDAGDVDDASDANDMSDVDNASDTNEEEDNLEEETDKSNSDYSSFLNKQAIVHRSKSG